MLRATRVMPGGEGAGTPVDAVRLDRDGRHRRRLAMTTLGGLSFLLDLPAATPLKHGDALVLEDGRTVRVEAEAEPLAEITAPDMASVVRIAWHLGNRHLPTALQGTTLLIRRDHVIEEMVTRLGGTVRHVEAPFDPEGGAYGHGAVHGHDHHHHHHDGGHAHG